MVSYSDHWMSAVHRQKLLQMTSLPKLLAGFLPNLAGMVLIRPFFKIVKIVPVD